MIKRLLESLRERRDKVLNGGVNCIPSKFTRFRSDFVGVEQGKFYLVSGGTKSGKTNIGSSMFIYDPLFYAYYHPEQVHLKVFYFPLEESPESITLRFMSHILFKLSKGRHRISPNDLKSTNENNPVSEEILQIFETQEFRDILQFYEENVMFFDTRNATGIYKRLREYAESNGVTHYKDIQIKNKETGSIETVKVFDYYEPNDPKETVIIFIDHISLLSSESGMDLRQSINKCSEYLVTLRNRYNYTPVVLQQQNLETLNLEAVKANRIRPTLAGLADSKEPGKSCNMMLGITNPSAFEIPSYLGYDITKFKGNIRFLEVVLNRDGLSNGIVALLFDGATCTFNEMPLPTDTNKINSTYNYITELKTRLSKAFFLKVIRKNE